MSTMSITILFIAIIGVVSCRSPESHLPRNLQFTVVVAAVTVIREAIIAKLSDGITVSSITTIVAVNLLL